ncbi:MAG: hypothetical protein H6816_05085 [Phycisphaerales bacterium]|nr:hypothetical protein [Phycisphaerales bacterium]
MRSGFCMRRARRLSLGLVAVLALTGCSQHRHYTPPVDPNQLTDIQFVHYLETVPVVTFGEGCRAVLIAADGADRFDSFAARYAELERRGWVRDAWGLEADDLLDLGTMCFMAAEACDLPPSASSTVLGSWGLSDRRYAVRKAVAAKLVASGRTSCR